MTKKLKPANRYPFAISRLTILKDDLDSSSKNARIKGEAISIIREFGDESMLEQFITSTKERRYTTPDVLSEKIDTALSVAIEDFKNRNAFEAVHKTQIDDFGKVWFYLFWLVLLVGVIIALNNVALFPQIQIGLKQSLIFILLPVVVLSIHYFRGDRGDKWFAFILAVVTILIDRLIPHL